MYAIRVNENTTNQVQSKAQSACSDSDLIGFFIGDSHMKRIPLSKGMFALVDDEDYERLAKYYWCARKGRNTFYADRSVKLNGKWTTISMHREIFGLPKNKQIDHADHNGLNNQKYNLRICTPAQNQQNRLPYKGFSSRYKGVGWAKDDKKWRSYIYPNYKFVSLGYFDSEIEAANAYDAKAKELFGEFARLNNAE